MQVVRPFCARAKRRAKRKDRIMASTRMMMDGGRASYKRTTGSEQTGKTAGQIKQEEDSFYERTKNLPAHIQALAKADADKAKRNTKSAVSTAIKKAEYDAKKERETERQQDLAFKNAVGTGSIPAEAVAKIGKSLDKIAKSNAIKRENKRQQLQSLKNAVATGTVPAGVAAKIAPKITGEPVEGNKKLVTLSDYDIEMQKASLDNAIKFGGVPKEVAKKLGVSDYNGLTMQQQTALENAIKFGGVPEEVGTKINEVQKEINKSKYSIQDIRTYADFYGMDFLEAKQIIDYMGSEEIDRVLKIIDSNKEVPMIFQTNLARKEFSDIYGGNVAQIYYGIDDDDTSDDGKEDIYKGEIEPKTIAFKGCGIVSAVMGIEAFDGYNDNGSYYDHVQEAAKFSLDGGYKDDGGTRIEDFTVDYAKSKGLDAYHTEDIQDVVEALERGAVVVASVTDGKDDLFTTGSGHIITLSNINLDGSIEVINPNRIGYNAYNEGNTSYSVDQIDGHKNNGYVIIERP